MSQDKNNTHYIVTYRDPRDGKVLSLKARKIHDSSLGLSFVSISDFVFESNSLLLNPAEEDLKKRFESVRSLHLSIYTILSIEEVGLEHQGLLFDKDKSNLLVMPGVDKPST